MNRNLQWRLLDLVAKRRRSVEHDTGGNVVRDMESELKSIHASIGLMLAASPVVIYTTEAKGDFTCKYISDNVRAIFGYAPDELTADPKHWPHNLHPDDAAHVINTVKTLIGQDGGILEYRFRHRDGHYVWVHDSFKIVRDDSGQPLELVGAWTDISEHKQAQDVLRKAYDELEARIDKSAEELKAGRQRLEYVLAVSPAITYATNATGEFECTFVSESSRQIMGYSPDEALAQRNFWLSHLHPQDAPHVLSEFARLIPQGGGNLEYRFRHNGGHYRWFQDTFQVVYDEAHTPTEIVGSWADITHRKLAEAVSELYSASLERQEPISLKKLDSILEGGREVLLLDRLSILRVDPQQEWLQAIATTGTEEPLEVIRVPIDPRGGGLAQAFASKEAIVWDGQGAVADELRLKPPFDQIRSLRSRVFAIVPLVVQGQAIGVLAADRKVNRVPFEPATLEALRGLATQAALALEHARFYASAQPVLNRSLNLSVVYPAFARAVKALLPYDRIGVIVPEGERLVMALSVAEPPLASWQGHSWVNAEGTAVDWVLKSRHPRVVRDLALQKDFPDAMFVAQEGVRATIMVPLLAGGTVVGAFFLDSRTPGAYTERDVELVDPVAQQLALAIDNTRLIQDIKALNDTVQAQSAKLADWNATLEKRVDEQLHQLENLSRLKRFFSPQLAEAIINGGTDDPLSTHRREVVVVFLDLRGFTAFAETSDPEDVMGVLREYHSEMGKLILEHEGTLERFTGDGMMIFFNDPVVVTNPTERALRMAIAMRERVEYLSKSWRKHGHDLSLGIGIAKGFATIGAIGFEGRLDYGAVGIVTNLAARLCSEARGGQILTSRKALSDIELMAEVETVGELALKGFSKPVSAFNIRSIRTEQLH